MLPHITGKRHDLPDRQIFIQSVGHFVSASISAIIDFSFNVDVWRGSTLFDRFDSAGLFVRLKKKTHHRNVFFLFFLFFKFLLWKSGWGNGKNPVRHPIKSRSDKNCVHCPRRRVSGFAFYFFFFSFFFFFCFSRSTVLEGASGHPPPRLFKESLADTNNNTRARPLTLRPDPRRVVNSVISPLFAVC